MSFSERAAALGASRGSEASWVTPGRGPQSTSPASSPASSPACVCRKCLQWPEQTRVNQSKHAQVGGSHKQVTLSPPQLPRPKRGARGPPQTPTPARCHNGSPHKHSRLNGRPCSCTLASSHVNRASSDSTQFPRTSTSHRKTTRAAVHCSSNRSYAYVQLNHRRKATLRGPHGNT